MYLSPIGVGILFAFIVGLAYIITKYDVGKQKFFKIIFGTWIAGAIFFFFFFFFMGVADGAYWEQSKHRKDNVYFLAMVMIVVMAVLLMMWARYLHIRGVQSDHFFAFVVLAVACGAFGVWLLGWAVTNTFGNNFLHGEHEKVDLGWLPDWGNWQERGANLSIGAMGALVGIVFSIFLLFTATIYLQYYSKKRRR